MHSDTPQNFSNPTPAAVLWGRLPRPLWILLALLATLLIGLAFYGDTSFRAWVVATQCHSGPHAHAIAAAFSHYGDWPELLAAGGTALLIFWKLGNKEWTKIMAVALIASSLAGLIAISSRVTTGRTRPDTSHQLAEQGWYGPWHNRHLLIGVPAYNSFPSGHTATAVGMASIILFARPLIGVPCMLLALAIAGSRLYLGKHHLSDVVVSAILALTVGYWSLRIFMEHEEAILSWIQSKISWLAPPGEE